MEINNDVLVKEYVKMFIIVTTVCSLIQSVVVIISSYFTMKKDVKGTIAISKKSLEIEQLKCIYNSLATIKRDILERDVSDKVTNSIKEVRNNLRLNELFFSTSCINKVNDLLDYFSAIVIDKTTRDINKNPRRKRRGIEDLYP